jgi:hypothetical protein
LFLIFVPQIVDFVTPFKIQWASKWRNKSTNGRQKAQQKA